jgi:hypothetical protein
MSNNADVTSSKLIAVKSQSISGVSAVNPLVAFYDNHGRKREVLFFCFVSDPTRDLKYILTKNGARLFFEMNFRKRYKVILYNIL